MNSTLQDLTNEALLDKFISMYAIKIEDDVAGGKEDTAMIEYLQKAREEILLRMKS